MQNMFEHQQQGSSTNKYENVRTHTQANIEKDEGKEGQTDGRVMNLGKCIKFQYQDNDFKFSEISRKDILDLAVSSFKFRSHFKISPCNKRLHIAKGQSGLLK